MLKQHKKQQNLQLGDALFGRHLHSQNYSICLRLLLYVQIQSPNAAKNKAPSDDGALFFATFGDGAKNFLPHSLCLGALPLLYPAAPPSVFACGKYTAPAVALEREYVVDFYANRRMTGPYFLRHLEIGAKNFFAPISMPRGSAPIIPCGSAFRICLRQIHGSRRRA